VKLLGDFRNTISSVVETYYNEKFIILKSGKFKKEISELKNKLKRTKYNKLKSFDNVFINLFDLIMTFYDDNYVSFKKKNYMTVFVKDFYDSYNLFANIITQNDIDFIKTIIKEFLTNKKSNNLALGFDQEYQNLFTFYNDKNTVNNIISNIKNKNLHSKKFKVINESITPEGDLLGNDNKSDEVEVVEKNYSSDVIQKPIPSTYNYKKKKFIVNEPTYYSRGAPKVIIFKYVHIFITK
jgi:hypothetical protein